jgi:hypothetical protein
MYKRRNDVERLFRRLEGVHRIYSLPTGVATGLASAALFFLQKGTGGPAHEAGIGRARARA